MSTTQDKAAQDSQSIIAELRQERDAALAQETALAELLVTLPRKMPASDGART